MPLGSTTRLTWSPACHSRSVVQNETSMQHWAAFGTSRVSLPHLATPEKRWHWMLKCSRLFVLRFGQLGHWHHPCHGYSGAVKAVWCSACAAQNTEYNPGCPGPLSQVKTAAAHSRHSVNHLLRRRFTSSRLHHSQLLPALVAHQACFTLRLHALQWARWRRLSCSRDLLRSVIRLSCCDRCFLQGEQQGALLS